MTMLASKVKKKYVIPKPKGMESPPEKDILKECRDWLKKQDFFWVRLEGSGKLMNAGGSQFMARSSMSGMPDLLILKDGSTFFIELKRPGGHITDEQTELLAKARESGAIVAVASSLVGLQFVIQSTAHLLESQTLVSPQCIPVFY